MRINPVGITAAENLTPDSLLHRKKGKKFLEYLIYFLMHESEGISKTNKQDCASAQMIIRNNEYARDHISSFLFFLFPKKSFSPHLCAMLHIPFSHHIYV